MVWKHPKWPTESTALCVNDSNIASLSTCIDVIMLLCSTSNVVDVVLGFHVIIRCPVLVLSMQFIRQKWLHFNYGEINAGFSQNVCRLCFYCSPCKWMQLLRQKWCRVPAGNLMQFLRQKWKRLLVISWQAGVAEALAIFFLLWMTKMMHSTCG